MKNLEVGECYTIKTGCFKGISGMAVESFGAEDFRKPVHILQSPDFPFGEVSFFGRLHALRRATPKEEVRFLRRITGLD
jgi:hypothetical protein